WISVRPDIFNWPNETPVETGRCCYGDIFAPSCAVLTLDECEALGSMISWNIGMTCIVNPCQPPPMGRCCYGDPYNPMCMTTYESTCNNLGDKISWTQGLNCTSNPCEAISSDLAGYWSLDEGTGTIAIDHSGNGNNGSFVSEPVWCDGIIDHALDFDGIDDYIQVPDAPSLDITGYGITFMAWVKSPLFTNYAWVIGKSGLGGWSDMAWWLLTRTDGAIRYAIKSDNSTMEREVTANLTTNTWYHLAVTYDASYMRLYVDGIVIDSCAKSGQMNANDGLLLIGLDGFNPSNHFNGIIDEVKLYNRSLSKLEIRAEINRTLRGYWKFDEGVGSITYDSSGHGNDGILTNGPAWVTGLTGKALRFDGVDDYVNCGSDPSLDMTDNLTISAWVNFDNLPSDKYAIVSKDDGWGLQNKWEFGYTNNYAGISDALHFHINNTSGADIWLNSLSWLPATGKWYFVAVTRHDSDYKFYVNGQLHGTASNSLSLPIVDYPLLIGRAEGSFHFAGKIDEVRVASREFSEEELWSIFAEKRCGDIDGSGAINLLDITFLISYLYKGGPAPEYEELADVNNSGGVNILDATFLISYLYKGGLPPNCE
ncbi:MAG: LamG-like jellyroll fold domain-containing protein, partial [Candidatus Zixiibacteriota bacterium]